ncbi:arylsulfatase [Streptomyces piniterrae]|uniref:Arylsulfatase n=1 Tax=Streptomyces piniterrae TaxID=2571125 RepID=A0A4U0NWY9_9ACTN|nr:aspartate/glutamate racemase family protein [Streptomyces piniterrae]TJZ59259.1 arylsulfatase [Streptomyces piniterrae]
MLALLHTSPVHIPTFDALRDEEAPGLPLRHLVRPELLSDAKELGPDAVADEVAGALADAVREGASAALCTCSTIGSVAEAAGAGLGLPVVRVDRPMAAAAVAAGTRIVVLATLESTLGPTVDLIADEAGRAGREVGVRTVLVAEAWERFESGDTEGSVAAIAAAGREVRDADAIVLAQASMTPAAPRITAGPGGVGVPVLSSPRLGLRAAAQLVARETSLSGLRTM